MPSISDLTLLSSTDVASTDELVIVDVSEALPADQTKRITVSRHARSLFEYTAAQSTTDIATDDRLLIYDTSLTTAEPVTLASLFAWQTYTPTITYSGGTTDPTSETFTTARYSRVGNVVNVGIDLSITWGSGDRTSTLISLPATAANIACGGGARHSLNGAGPQIAPAYFSNTTTVVIFHDTMTKDGVIQVSFTYEAT